MSVRTMAAVVLCGLLAGSASASWYWPFETDGARKKGEKRLSELMEPASLAIDEATDLVNDGKTDKAVEKYREALRLLERLEQDYPERAATPEFQSVRNKRAYVDAQLNAMLLEEARLNAKAVAVTDTTDLEEKLRRNRRASEKKPALLSELGEFVKDERARAKELERAAAAAKFERENEAEIARLMKADPESRKGRLMRAGLELYRKNYGLARKDVDALLAKNPDDVSALNLSAGIAAATGNHQAAEDALVRAINLRRGDYHAYYNLAKLLARRGGEGDLKRARILYASGKKPKDKGGAGGPEDPYLERISR